MIYKRRFTEEERKIPPEVIFDKKVSSILRSLRDSNFTNEEARKKLIDYLSSLHTSKDKRARQTFKRVGQFFTDVGDDLLKYGKE